MVKLNNKPITQKEPAKRADQASKVKNQPKRQENTPNQRLPSGVANFCRGKSPLRIEAIPTSRDRV